MLEGHVLFDMLDADSDFTRYRMLVLPDAIRCEGALLEKLHAYVAGGGRLLLSAASGLDEGRTRFLFDVGARTEGRSPFAPDYALPREGLRAPFATSPVVMHPCGGIPGGGASQRIVVKDGESLGDVFDPYFNRAWNHFCSHQHTPNRPEPSGFACGARKANVAYLAHPVFALYAREGAVAVREYLLRVLRALLGEPSASVSGLPSTGRMTLLDQPGERRSVLHLLYAPAAKRGGICAADVEVVEDLPLLHGVSVAIRRGVPSGPGGALEPIRRARLVPEGADLPLAPLPDGGVRIELPPFSCHAMVELS
ncbi:MAG: beta-galactosidase trimerization domain-containing protein [Kiritimatiellae bacterium]|nr:beta-galactosidase trimerization domain-containing protein [Kiritimatiellia bacterium]